MTRERRTGQARPAVSCGPHFSPRKDFLTLPFPGRASPFPSAGPVSCTGTPAVAAGSTGPERFLAPYGKTGDRRRKGTPVPPNGTKALPLLRPGTKTGRSFCPSLSIQPGPFRRAPARPGGLCASPDRHGPGHGSGIFPCPPPRAHGRLPRWGPSRHGRRPRRSDRDRWPRPL